MDPTPVLSAATHFSVISIIAGYSVLSRLSSVWKRLFDFVTFRSCPIKALGRIRGIDQTADFLRIFEVSTGMVSSFAKS